MSPRFLTLFLFALLVFLAGCRPGDSAVTRGALEGRLVRGNATEPESLDPHLVRGQVEWTIIISLFEGLVTRDATELTPRPGVAERWDISPDGLSYVFHLRRDAKWSDGAPVTADDFIFSARRLLAPRLGSAQSEDNLLFLRGARDYHSGRSTDFSLVGIRKVDTHTLTMELERPTSFFLSALLQFFPVPERIVTAHGAWDDRGNAWAVPGRLIGNGPFVLQEWTHSQRIVLRKNPAYWDAARVQLQELQLLPIENAAAEETAFRTGQLHMTFTVPFAKLENYRALEHSPLRQVEDRGTYFYTFNVTKGPLTDKRLRQALSLALDRQKLSEVVLRGLGRPATSLCPPGIGGYQPPSALRFDPERARALLAEAGYPQGAGLPALELLYDSRDYHRTIAEVAQQMWRQHLGVQVTLRSHETQVVIAAKNQMDFQLARGWWNASYDDPYYFLGPWKTGGLYNEARWTNSRYDELIEQSWSADPAERQKVLAEAESLLLEEMPVLPLFFSRAATLVDSTVQGLSPTPFADRQLSWLSLAPPSSR